MIGLSERLGLPVGGQICMSGRQRHCRTAPGDHQGLTSCALFSHTGLRIIDHRRRKTCKNGAFSVAQTVNVEIQEALNGLKLVPPNDHFWNFPF